MTSETINLTDRSVDSLLLPELSVLSLGYSVSLTCGNIVTCPSRLLILPRSCFCGDTWCFPPSWLEVWPLIFATF